MAFAECAVHYWQSGTTSVCRNSTAESPLLGHAGLMPVQAVDASCGTLELPSHPHAPEQTAQIGQRAPSQDLFWGQLPLRHLVRACAGGSPFTGAPWQRLITFMPLAADGAAPTKRQRPAASAPAAIAERTRGDAEQAEGVAAAETVVAGA